MKIDIEVFKMPDSVISNVKKCYVELLPDRLIYCHDYDVDIPADIENEVYNNDEFRVIDKATYKKEAIVGAALSSKRIAVDEDSTDEDFTIYSVVIPISNTSESIEVSFETLTKANDFHKKIIDYIFKDASKSVRTNQE